MLYMVTAEGPGFADRDEAIEVLENFMLPSFDTLLELEAGGRILAGGIPIGERTFVFIVEARSHEDLDRLLREMPMWGVVEWEVSALQTFASRAAQERECLEELKHTF